MIYELKKYVPNSGKGPALKKRFAAITLPIFSRLGIRVLYCFEDGADPEALYYLTVFESTEKRDAAWKAFAADPEWQRGKADSETDGPLLGSQTTMNFQPTAFSPSL
jgi:hypothetical protein